MFKLPKLTPKDKKTITIVVVVVLFLSAVMALYDGMNKGVSYLTTDSSPSYDYGEYYADDSYMMEDSMMAEEEMRYIESDGVAEVGQDEKIQKYGYLSVTVTDLDEGRQSVESYANRYGGSIASLNESGTGDYRTVSISIKVPVARFDDLIEDLRGMATDVESAEVSTQDVTDQYYDIEARLENQQALEAQLVELLDQAADVEDVLLVQAELSTVRETIERYEAQLDYLEESTDYSTVTITMSLSADEKTVVDDKWSATAVFKEAAAALVDLAQQMAGGVIWFVVFIPVFALITLLAWIIKVVSKKKSGKKSK